ncbi:sulfite exporter TauE/SafE family protein [Desulfonatronospira sp.]|uniref:sulfite exporter TauE/SafE family protein n=2 Tax=Desulfonatronospira sp. TaxID=1962951 RepID=UPI0025C3D7DF|nr:sulfite exporter TauE/SafE family protein [Desulfonatronospira sp.]
MDVFLLIYPAIFLASFVLSMAGLGGGLIFAPLFIVLGFGQGPAVASSLFLNGLAAATASYIYIKQRMVDFGLCIPLIITSGLAAPLGALTTRLIDQQIFLLVMSTVILMAAVRMFLPIKMPNATIYHRHGWTASKLVQASLIGILIGFMAGMLGLGGGVFVVPLLVFVLHVHPKTAAASTAFIVCFSSFTGFFSHAAAGGLDWKFLLLAGVFSSAGGLAGSRLMSSKMSGEAVKKLFACILMLLSIYLFFQGI